MKHPTSIASISRIFMNEQMHWTLQATCSECLRETTALLITGVPIECEGCGRLIKVDPDRTVFHRTDGTGCAPEPVRRFRWGRGILRPLPFMAIRGRRDR
jgi:hypothetical protein